MSYCVKPKTRPCPMILDEVETCTSCEWRESDFCDWCQELRGEGSGNEERREISNGVKQ